MSWCPRQESNLQPLLRTELLYPFNYEGKMLRTEHFAHKSQLFFNTQQIGNSFFVITDHEFIADRNDWHTHLP